MASLVDKMRTIFGSRKDENQNEAGRKQDTPRHAPAGFWPSVAFTGEEFSDAASAYMRLTHIELDVYLNANFPTVSQSTMTMTFRNDHNRVLEGELQFTLPKGSTVAGYGVDINGEMVDGVPIEKEKAKVVFEAEVRKRTNATPAIAEMVNANIFKTRIYPLPANGSRKVRLSYETRISFGKDSPFTHRVPATIAEGIENLSVRCHCLGFHESEAPEFAQIEGEANSVPEFDFKWHDGASPGSPGKFVGELSATSSDLVKGALADIRVVLPFKESVCAIEADVEADRKEDEVGAYFCICDTMTTTTTTPITPPAGEDAGQEGAEGQEGGEGHVKQKSEADISGSDADADVGELSPPAPSHVCVVWDCSLSRQVKSTREQEIGALRSLLEQDAWKDTQISLVEARNVCSAPLAMTRDEHSGWEKLLEHLNNLDYDGATNLGEVNFNARWNGEQETPFDFMLLFSDGMATLGREEPQDTKIPVYAINFGGSDGQHNHDFLRFLSEKSGAKYFDMTSAESGASVAQLKEQIGRPVMRFLGAECDDDFVKIITPISDNDTFIVSGTLNAEEATVILKYGYTEGKPVLLREFKLRMCDAIPSGGVVRRQWARQRMSEMLPFPTKYKDELAEIGKKYAILTPATSFIVLETLQQHLDHNIAPHASRKTLCEQYDAHMEGARVKKEESLQEKIAKVSGYINSRQAWYERNFDVPDVPAKKASEFCSTPTLHFAPMGRSDRGTHDNEEEEEREPEEQWEMDAGGSMGFFSSSRTSLGRGSTMTQSLGLRDMDRSFAADAPIETLAPALPPTLQAQPAPTLAPMRKKTRSANAADLRRDCRVSASHSAAPSSQRRGSSGAQGTALSGKRGGGSGAQSGKSISLQAWDPKTPYMQQIKAESKYPYRKYLQLRAHYEKSPSFYFDVSSLFETTLNNTELAVRILTNVLELNLENAQVLRTVGYKLMELGMIDGAAGVFEKVKRLCPAEPQSYRDLALALLNKNTKVYDPSRALRLLDKAVTGTWDQRFHEIELTCLMEMAHAVDMHGFDRSALHTKPGLKTPERLLKKFDVDLRIVLGWDTDMTDVDLHVREPTGEECMYNHKNTRIGGSLSRDFVNGFGPEEYILKKARPGKYIVKAKYFANRQQSLTGATTLLLAVFKHYGDKEKEERKFISLRLSGNKKMLKVGDVQFP